VSAPAPEITAQSIEARVAAIARGIQASRPRVIGLIADNSPDWIAVDLAAERAGAALVPLPAFFTPAQMRHAADTTGMDALICQSPDTARALGFQARTAMDATGVNWYRREVQPVALPAGTTKITFTSGTTGTPKGICLGAGQQGALVSSLVHATRGLGIERHLCLLPLPVLLENVAGARTALAMGAECAAPPLGEVGMTGAAAFDARACLAAIGRWRADSVILLPQMLMALTAALEAGAPPARLKFAAVGGARVAPTLIERARAAGIPAHEGYGLTECASVVSLNLPGADRVGSVGRPLPHVRVAIGQDGEVLVAGNDYLGCLDRAGEAPPATGVPTGDRGRIDADGYLHIEGRVKHVLITSFGRNVAPEWPEAELVAGGVIIQAAVFGEARPRLSAVVVPRLPETGDAAIQSAVERANRRLPDYARIASWLRADAPFTPGNGLATDNGRVRREAIWSRYGARLDALERSQSSVRES
jgi:long-subunit acyl-CoA synthetase (AMP-forming)